MYYVCACACVCVCVDPTVIQRELGEMFAVQVGTTATLPCEATSDQGATLTYSWTKDGLPLPLNSRMNFVDSSVNGNLFVSSVELDDVGSYQCTITTMHNGLSAPNVSSESTSLQVTG